MTTETWYKVEYSRTGADDWYGFSATHDSFESAKRSIPEILDFEFRVVEIQATSRVVTE